MKQVTSALMALIVIGAFLYLMGAAITDPTYQNNLTTRYQAQQQTRQVQAREWGDTLRTWGMWGGGGLAAVGGLVAIGWTVRHWQEQRTRRHEASEDHTTQRLRITTQKDVALAWLAQFGVPERDRIGTHGGTLGVFTVEGGQQTFVPWDVCRAELATAQGTALALRTPPTITVPGEDDRTFKIVRGDW